MLNIRQRQFFGNIIGTPFVLPTPPDVLTARLFIDGFDPGWSSPCVWLRGALLAHRWVHIFAEIVVTKTTLLGVLHQANALPYPASTIVGADHSVGTHEQTSGQSLEEQIRHTGRRVIAPYSRVESRLAFLHGWLQCRPGGRRLTIDPSCAVLLDSITLYAGKRHRRDEWKCSTPKHSHSIDTACYLVHAAAVVDREPSKPETSAAV